MGELFGELSGYLGQHQVTPVGPYLAAYHDPEYRERDADVEAAAPLGQQIPAGERVKVHDLPAGQMACTTHQGNYDAIGEAYTALMRWIESNNCRISGPGRQVYLQGPGESNDTSSYVTEVQFPVEKT